MQLQISMRNCYGIGELDQVLTFDESNVQLVYAPNGVMKTSFLQVFEDHRNGDRPIDRVFKSREATYSIRTGDGEMLSPELVLTVGSPTDRIAREATSLLMVNEELRSEYQGLAQSLEAAADSICDAVSRANGAGRDGRHLLARAFGTEAKHVPELLHRLSEHVRTSASPGLDFVKPKVVFNDKVRSFMKDAETVALLKDYMDKYGELIEASEFFRPGGFNHYHATTVGKSLKGAKFFDARHALLLSRVDSSEVEVRSADDLQRLVDEEKNKILTDPSLAQRFNAIDKKLDANQELRDFREFLEAHPECVPLLTDFDRFEQEVWLSGLFTVEELRPFAEAYEEAVGRMRQIAELAKAQQTEWHEVVAEFMSRFEVPYRLRVENQQDVILRDEAPVLVFDYDDGRGETESLSDAELSRVLSTGESRALYILNVIFEMRSRVRGDGPVVVIFDDPADSFDYRNKYGIIEYLADIAESGNFRVVILTHNFDFYRTVFTRLGLRHKDAFMAGREGGKVVFYSADYIKDPLGKLRDKLNTDRKCLIASIPFARNLIEFRGETGAGEYMTLTSALHIKSRSSGLSLNDVATVVEQVLNRPNAVARCDELVLDVIFQEADSCVAGGEPTCLEKKVCLSIAIRLRAERYMLSRLEGAFDTETASSNQTRGLFKCFCKHHAGDPGMAILKKVMLMTPESIHLNSFMYEPLLDMSEAQLCKLNATLVEMLAQ